MCLSFLAGCGGDPARGARPPAAPGRAPGGTTADGRAAVSPGAATANGAADPTRPSAVGGGTGAGPGGGQGSGTGAPSAPSRAIPSNLPGSAPMTVRLAYDCVTPGGTQRVVVDTLPEAYIAYDNLYADRRDGAVHGGVDGRARSDARGRFEASWVVAPGAPIGDVRLDIGASAGDRATIRMLFYRVAATCP